MENLFKNFEGVDKETWLEKIRTDLKGKSEDLLKYEVERGITVTSYQHRSDYEDQHFSIGKDSNSFFNRKCYDVDSNATILEDLNEGVDHLALNFKNQAAFDAMVDGVAFEHIAADVKFTDPDGALNFSGPASAALNFDFLSLGLQEGAWKFDSSQFISFYRTQKANSRLWITGSQFGEAGATAVQELAFSASLLNEYLELLKAEDKSGIEQGIHLELSVTEDYFLNVAKFKVARQIVATVLKAHNLDANTPLKLIAVTSKRKLAENDANNNLLRQTTQAMSAIVGGCDAITISTQGENEIHQRMAKNIPLVLKEESYFDKVADPAEGSYYVSEVCAQLLAKSWQLFQATEAEGGFCAAAESNSIQDQIFENQAYLIDQINACDKTFLGVNKFPSSLEDWKTVESRGVISGASFKPLQAFSIEENFKKELHEQS